MKRRKSVPVRLPPGLLDELRAAARASGRTEQDIVIAALREWLNGPKGSPERKRDTFERENREHHDRVERCIEAIDRQAEFLKRHEDGMRKVDESIADLGGSERGHDG